MATLPSSLTEKDEDSSHESKPISSAPIFIERRTTLEDSAASLYYLYKTVTTGSLWQLYDNAKYSHLAHRYSLEHNSSWREWCVGLALFFGCATLSFTSFLLYTAITSDATVELIPSAATMAQATAETESSFIISRESAYKLLPVLLILCWYFASTFSKYFESEQRREEHVVANWCRLVDGCELLIHDIKAAVAVVTAPADAVNPYAADDFDFVDPAPASVVVATPNGAVLPPTATPPVRHPKVSHKLSSADVWRRFEELLVLKISFDSIESGVTDPAHYLRACEYLDHNWEPAAHKAITDMFTHAPNSPHAPVLPVAHSLIDSKLSMQDQLLQMKMIVGRRERYASQLPDPLTTGKGLDDDAFGSADLPGITVQRTSTIAHAPPAGSVDNDIKEALLTPTNLHARQSMKFVTTTSASAGFGSGPNDGGGGAGGLRGLASGLYGYGSTASSAGGGARTLASAVAASSSTAGGDGAEPSTVWALRSWAYREYHAYLTRGHPVRSASMIADWGGMGAAFTLVASGLWNTSDISQSSQYSLVVATITVFSALCALVYLQRKKSINLVAVAGFAILELFTRTDAVCQQLVAEYATPNVSVFALERKIAELKLMKRSVILPLLKRIPEDVWYTPLLIKAGFGTRPVPTLKDLTWYGVKIQHDKTTYSKWLVEGKTLFRDPTVNPVVQPYGVGLGTGDFKA